MDRLENKHTNFIKNRVKKIRRSTLIVPSNVERFIKKAAVSDADAIQFDLEDSVPGSGKGEGRCLIRHFLENECPKGEINVRINSDHSLWEEDIYQIVRPGLDSVTIPKCEDADFIRAVDNSLAAYEKERGMAPGRVSLSILIESVYGLHHIEELLESSTRIDTVALGNEDFSRDLGIEVSESGEELFAFYAKVVYYARLFSIMPLGMVGSISDYNNLQRFKRLAKKGKQLGFMGSSCIHPNQVPVLNRLFTPAAEEIQHAEQVVEVFERAEKQGRSSCSLNGKMIDPPIYERAVHTLERDRIIQSRQVTHE